MEPAKLVEPYPTEVVTLRDGTPVAIRAIRPDDAPRLQMVVSRLSPQTAFWRFGVPLNALTDAEARRLASVDYRRNMALVATREPQGSDELVGVARYAAVGPEAEAEVAIVVADDYQGRGLGALLLQRLAAYACSQGTCAFVATISPANERVLNMVRRSGLPTQLRAVGPGEMHVRIQLGRPAGQD